MRLFLLIAFVTFAMCFSAAQDRSKVGRLDPWDIKEINRFHTLLHRITSEYYERKNIDVLIKASSDLDTVFSQLQNAKLPEKFSGKEKAYSVYVGSIKVALALYKKALQGSVSESLEPAFENIDETFELGIPKLRKAFNE